MAGETPALRGNQGEAMTDDKPEPQAPTDAKAESQSAAAQSAELEHWGDAPEKMRKGIQLYVTLYIEGDDAPAHDFSKSTIEAVRDIITAGSSKHPELTVTIKKIAEK
jgi:hypothetical protein